MKKSILILISALLMFGTFLVTAQTSYDMMLEECEKAVNEYNLEGKSIPTIFPYSNDVFNAYDFKKRPLGHLEIKNKKIVSYNCDIAANPTYNVFVRSINTITEIKESNDPLSRFNDKLEEKEIQVKGIQIKKKLKWALTRPLIKIGAWFS